jgi:hypothetical protein
MLRQPLSLYDALLVGHPVPVAEQVDGTLEQLGGLGSTQFFTQAEN